MSNTRREHVTMLTIQTKSNQACIYTRFSSTNQRCESVKIQYEHCLEYAKKNNLEVIRHYSDQAKSGTTSDREQFNLMLSDAKNGDFAYVIVYNLSRFSRNILDHLHSVEYLESNNVQLLSVMEGFDNSTPEGDLFNMITMALNQFYSSNLSRAVLRGSIATAREENFCGGTPPLGYQIVNQKYVIDSKESETVKTIFRLFLVGNSFTFMSNYLNEHGMLTKLGNFWKGNFEHILTNRKYTGCMTYNLYKRRKLFSKSQIKEPKDPSEHIIIPNVFPAIITEEEFEDTQEMLRKMKILELKDLCHPRSLLEGFIRCGKCGKMMTIKKHVGGTSGSVTKIYKCKGGQSKKCKNSTINIRYMDNYILRFLTEFFARSSPDIKELVKEKMRTEYATKLEELENLKKFDIEEEHSINELTERLATLPAQTQEKLNRTITEKVLHKLAREKEIKTRERHLEQLRLKGTERFRIESVKRRFMDSFKSGELTKMREFLYDVMPSITISGDDVVVVLDFSSFLDNFRSIRLLADFKIDRKEILKLGKNKKTLVNLDTDHN